MATEADTSGSELLVSMSHHHSHRQQQIFQTMENIKRKFHIQVADSFDNVDKPNDDVDKFISVDEFDDSDNEDIRSCSTISPTPSDHVVNSSVSSRKHGSSYKTASNITNAYKLRKKHGLTSKVLDEDELQNLRLKINSRERKRMHDLNSALDGLREVMPYAHGPSVRKLSKIATLLLAKNYILMLNSSLEEMKKLVSDIYHNHGPPPSLARIPIARSLAPQVAHANDGTAGSNSGGAPTKSSNSRKSVSLSKRSMSPTSNSAETPTSFSYPLPSIPLTHLASHQTAFPPPMLPLSVPAIRASAPGLAPHDIGAFTSAYATSKSETSNIQGITHVYPTRECVHPLHRWSVPCGCVHCLSSMDNLPLGVHFNRISHPLVTSTSMLRKN